MKKRKLNSKNPKYWSKERLKEPKVKEKRPLGTTGKVFAVYKKQKIMSEITKEQFEAYVDVQMSGVTNMFDVRTVGDLSGLEKEQIITIMKSYGELKDKYDEQRRIRR